MALCPCCSNAEYERCCGPIISGVPAQTPEALVRSRYTAFFMRNLDYVSRTHAREIRDDFNRAEAERLAEDCQFRGLRIHSAREMDDTAEVEFVVQFYQEKKIVTRGSASRFRRENGEWFYISSKPAQHIINTNNPKIGRNESCLCGSGKKFKKCCGMNSEKTF